MKTRNIPVSLLIVAIVMNLTGCNKEDREYETFTWYYPCKTFEDSKLVNDKANEIFREKLGVEVNLVPIDQDFYNKKMSIMVSLDEQFDICYTSNWTNNFYDNVVYEDVYVQLDELLKETPYLQETIPEIAWTGSKIEGKIYAVPNYQVLSAGQRSLIVEKEVYEKYKDLLNGVKKIEDLEPFLEKSASELNSENIFRGNNGPDFWLMNEQIVGAEMFVVNVGEAEVFCSYLQPEYKAYIELMSEWYNKGYLSEETSASNSLDVLVTTDMYKPGFVKYDSGGNRKNVEVVLLSDVYLSQNVGVTAMTAINKKCKDPLTALKIIELVNKDKELYNLLCFGVEGVHYEKKSENVIELKDNMKYRPAKDWVFGNQFNAYYTSEEDVGSWDETDRMNRTAKHGKLIGFIFNQEKVRDEIMMMKSVVSEYEYLSKGVSEIGDDYDEFVRKLKEAGCEKVEKEIQRQIDEFLEKKESGG